MEGSKIEVGVKNSHASLDILAEKVEMKVPVKHVNK